MAYLALYRRYRPKDFNGIIGQDHIVKTLTNQISTGRLGHAYLFTGTRGTGKTSTAKIFAKAINCETPVNGSPCGKCAACKALADPSNIDVIEIDAASNNGVNEIRELRENAQFTPVACKYKVYIVDEVHMLSGAAFNALLKTLEEPPKHAVFILATTEVHKLPATILSRCMRFDFRLVPTEKIAKLIEDIYDEQGKKYEKEAVFAIAKAGEGSIRDALSIADTALSYGEGTLTYEQVNDILGASNRELLTVFTENLLKGDSGEVLNIIESLSTLGKSMGVLIKDVTDVIRNILVVKTCKTANSLLGLPEQEFNGLKNLSELATEERLVRILSIFADAENSLRYTTHPRIVFETAAVKATRPEKDYDIDALLARVKALEEKIANANFNVNNSPINAELTASAVNNVKEDKAEEHNKVYSAPVKKAEDVKEEKQEEVKISIDELSEEEVKGKLLSGLRKLGSEMLWNTMQKVGLKSGKGEIYLIPENPEDYALLTLDANKQKITDALSGVEFFRIEIKEPNTEKQITEIEDATERLKKIFGDDIVIVKH